MGRFFKKNKFLILLLSVTLLFRIPSFFEPYWYGDENIYLAIGTALRKGYLLYRDIFDNKPPLIYLLGALVNGKIFWYRLLLSVSLLFSTIYFYKLSTLFFKTEKTKVKISTLLFAFLTTGRILEGNIANAELFILLPSILGLYLFFKKEKRVHSYWSIGLLFSVGFLFKVPAVFDFLALLVFSILFSEKKLINLSKKDLSLYLGYILPIGLTGLFFLVKGSFGDFFSASFLQMFGYLGSWKAGSHSFSPVSLIKSELALKAFFTFLLVVLLWLKRNSIPKLLSFLGIWFAFSLFAATLSGRPYPHYLVQAVPSFCLLIVWAVGLKPKKLLLIPAVAIGLLIFSLIHYRFWWYSSFPYYRNFLSFAVGQKTKTQYFEFFNPRLPVIYQAAEFIAANSASGDKIFVWADEPAFYLLSQRLPSTAYLVAYHIKDLGLKSKAISQIQKGVSKIIVVDRNMDKFPQLEIILSLDYFKIREIENFMIFRRKILLPLKK